MAVTLLLSKIDNEQNGAPAATLYSLLWLSVHNVSQLVTTTRCQIKRNPPWHQALAPMRLPTIARRDALSFALASSLLTALPNRPAFAADGVASNFGETAEELKVCMCRAV